MTKLVEILGQPYYSPAGIVNPGELCGLPDAVATALIAAGGAALHDSGAGSGTPTASPQRGILASETPAQYAAAGGTLGDQQVSAAIEGYLGGADVTIVDGHARPSSEPWA
jgi:hypothetical protein